MRASAMAMAIPLVCLCASPSAVAKGGEYGLDALARSIEPTGKMHCPKLPMTRYKGDTIRFHKPVHIYEGFQPALAELEHVATEVAIEIYGRAPSRIVHVGTYNCRRIRRIPDLLSEHALGNAIDIEGFDFGPAKGEQRGHAPSKRLRRSFQVRVDAHWNSERDLEHAEFLRRFTEVLLEREVFRVYLGPAFPGHQDHFHFDLAPYELISL